MFLKINCDKSAQDLLPTFELFISHNYKSENWLRSASKRNRLYIRNGLKWGSRMLQMALTSIPVLN